MLMSFKQEISAVRESLSGIEPKNLPDPESRLLFSQLGTTLEELLTADEEIARHTRQFELLANELHATRGRYRALFESLPVACVITDLNGTVRAVNPAGAALLGGELSIVGKPILVRIPEDQRGGVRTSISRAKLGESGKWSGTLLRRDHVPLTAAFTLNRMTAEGPGIEPELLWTIADVAQPLRQSPQVAALTERVQALTAANQDLEHAAHIVAHDLKEPLRGMLLTAGFLEEDVADLGEDARLRIATIKSLCARAMSLVDTVLQAAEIRGTPLRPESVRLADLVKDATQHLLAVIEGSGARVTCRTPEMVLTCDRAQVARALANLIANGVKYNNSPEKQVLIEGVDGEKDITIRVTDNGVGIPADHAGSLFCMFGRIPNTADAAPATPGGAAANPHVALANHGTGAGLAIVRKIMEKHGGNVWVEPAQPEGSTFCLKLPRGGAREVTIEGARFRTNLSHGRRPL
jgi:PAS domain S-box-containing protein